MGTVDVTWSGIPCRDWRHASSADEQFPEGSREAANNYCRNPDPAYYIGLWCYTSDPDNSWQTCDVPMCTRGKSAADCTAYKLCISAGITAAICGRF